MFKKSFGNLENYPYAMKGPWDLRPKERADLPLCQPPPAPRTLLHGGTPCSKSPAPFKWLSHFFQVILSHPIIERPQNIVSYYSPTSIIGMSKDQNGKTDAKVPWWAGGKCLAKDIIQLTCELQRMPRKVFPVSTIGPIRLSRHLISSGQRWMELWLN